MKLVRSLSFEGGHRTFCEYAAKEESQSLRCGPHNLSSAFASKSNAVY